MIDVLSVGYRFKQQYSQHSEIVHHLKHARWLWNGLHSFTTSEMLYFSREIGDRFSETPDTHEVKIASNHLLMKRANTRQWYYLWIYMNKANVLNEWFRIIFYFAFCVCMCAFSVVNQWEYGMLKVCYLIWIYKVDEIIIIHRNVSGSVNVNAFGFFYLKYVYASCMSSMSKLSLKLCLSYLA